MLNDKQVHNIYASFGEELVGRCWENWGGSPMGCSQCVAQISVLPGSVVLDNVPTEYNIKDYNRMKMEILWGLQLKHVIFEARPLGSRLGDLNP